MGEDPWKEVGPDSTYAVNGFDLLFVFVLVMMLGIKFNLCKCSNSETYSFVSSAASWNVFCCCHYGTFCV